MFKVGVIHDDVPTKKLNFSKIDEVGCRYDLKDCGAKCIRDVHIVSLQPVSSNNQQDHDQVD